MKKPKIIKASLYYDLKGKPIDVLEWARQFSKNRFIKQSYLYFNYIQISTIYLGLDHSFNLATKPLIFETMIFCRFPNCHDEHDFQDRYATMKDALKHHNVLKRKLSNPLIILRHLLAQHIVRGGELQYDKYRRSS